MRRHVPVLLACALLSALPSARVHAQVRRCDVPGAGTVYTDRRCDALGGVERPATPAASQVHAHRAACPRTLRDLALEVGFAVDAKDVNRLASVYHWAGMSSAHAFAVMERLQAVVDRQLVDLQPVYPHGADDPYAYPPAGTRPVGLRLEQVSKNGHTPVRATFGLRRHLDCWWITGAAPAPRATQAAPAALPGG